MDSSSTLFFVFPGKFPFISNLILFWISGTLFHMAPTSDGGEQIALCLSTMLLTFSVGGLMTSIPCKLVNIEKYAASWFFVWHMMIKIQMFVVYFQAGVSKLAVESWTDGSEIYYDMINPMFGASGWRLEFSLFFVSNSFLLLVLTWGAIFCEIFISFAIFGSDNVKIIAIIFAIILHTSIAFFLGITSFSIIMIGGAIYSLLPDRFAYERGVFSDDEKLDS